MLSYAEARQSSFIQRCLSDDFCPCSAGVYPSDFNGLNTVCVDGQLKSQQKIRLRLAYSAGINLKYLISLSGCCDLVTA